MMVHELATNVVKYGALSNSAGVVTVSWTIGAWAEASWVVLVWQERDAPGVSPPTQKGFGSRLIERGLSFELHGSDGVDFQPDGLVATLGFPMPRAEHSLPQPSRGGPS
jgi:two-component sensor histidine kinase